MDRRGDGSGIRFVDVVASEMVPEGRFDPPAPAPRALLSVTGAETAAIETLAWHPVRVGLYALWLASLVWFAAVVLPRHGRC